MLAVWIQRYEPVADNLALSALVAALPVIVLLGLLGLLRVRAHYAALAGLATAFLVALLVYEMPAPMAMAALANGALFGLFPIGWIVVTAMFVYDLTVKTGQFELVKDSIAGMASDRRIQVLLVAFCFGAFIEGSAGFGTPVAISAAMLIGLGFQPLPAAGLSLIGNTAPVAFGAIGTPVLTLAGVTNLPVDTLSAMVGRQPLPPTRIPFAFTTFPGEIWRTPRSWVEASYPNVTYFHEVDKGGHFAAWEEPQLLSEEIRAAFRSLR